MEVKRVKCGCCNGTGYIEKSVTFEKLKVTLKDIFGENILVDNKGYEIRVMGEYESVFFDHVLTPDLNRKPRVQILDVENGKKTTVPLTLLKYYYFKKGRNIDKINWKKIE